MSKEDKRKIDDELVNCNIRDARSFNDFSKRWMRNFLKTIKPENVPCCRETVAK